MKFVYGVMHPRYATAVNNLGAIYLGIGDEANSEQPISWTALK